VVRVSAFSESSLRIGNLYMRHRRLGYNLRLGEPLLLGRLGRPVNDDSGVPIVPA